MVVIVAVAVDNCGARRPARCTLSRMIRLLRTLRDDRGDVPGWVLITLMTAGLVIIIWGLAGPALSSVFQQAIDRVVGF
jgi:hypothetical protein